MDDIATKYLKTYQVWHHRRLLITHVRNPAYELEFIAQGLQEDAKNYHTWAYRQWILAEFNEDDLWAGELTFVEDMLHQDIRNNSAWHHRFFVLWDSGVHRGQEDRVETLKYELRFVKYKISIAPNNPSAWNYLRGVLEHTSAPLSSIEAFVVPYTKPKSVNTLNSGESTPATDLDDPLPSAQADLPCTLAVEFLADIYVEKTSQGIDADESLKAATDLYGTLAKELDPMRQRYYEYLTREAALRHPVGQTAVPSA